jgi:hypothetical protein
MPILRLSLFRALRLLPSVRFTGPVAALLALLATAPLGAASTGTVALHTPQGSGAATANGDYITGGLNGLYRYFIEVPPGLGRLVVEIFDADVGRGGAAEAGAGRDRARNGFNTQVDYSLIRPDGTTAATLNNCSDTTCNDNAWTAILDSMTAANTAAGHWELRVDMTSAATGGDDINAIGIRAHDGTSGAGGTELPVYYDSQANVGVNPPGSGTTSRSYTLYPYITSGCSASKNDFDFDSNNGNTGSISVTSRTGAFTQSYTSAALSTDDVWRRDTFSGWTSDQQSVGYGIWQESRTITSYLVGGTPNGNYANVWFGNFQAAANPPAANPTTNAFRVYLPTDAGTAPVEPYVEQLLTFKSGTNPVPVGQTGVFQVTVRVVNPTAQAITFSAANLVTANVPGAGATYGGSAAVSQGSITGQPAVGGTGNVTWNPGTVAAGATAGLTYRVNVTPTSAGQRIPVTATPASGNGTRARYVDGTGNTTQTRATFTFGPICELATTQGVLTEAVVSSLTARRGDRGGVEVEWETASEAGTAGFYLYRWDAEARRYTRVNEQLLAGLPSAPQGGSYRLLDEDASPYGVLRYVVEEVEAGGNRNRYGPFLARVRDERPAEPLAAARAARPSGAGDLEPASPHPTPGRVSAIAVAAESRGSAGAPVVGPFKKAEAVHLEVRDTGLYHLSVGEIAGWLGAKAEEVGKLIGTGKLALSQGGVPVAWYPDPGRGRGKDALGLYFYGEGGEAGSPRESLYTAATVYRLERGKGLLMTAMPAAAAAPGAGGTFAESRHVERDLFPATGLPLDPESDYWFWEFLQGGDSTFGHRTFALDAPGVSSSEPATLRVDFQGVTASGIAGEHRAAVTLNGVALGETQWQGIAAREGSFPVPAGVVQESGNQVEITAQVGDGAPFSIYYLDTFDLSYRRSFRAAVDTLAFAVDAAVPVTVHGFSSGELRWLDVRDPRRPRWITGVPAAAESGGFEASFAAAPGARYLGVAAGVIQHPSAVRPWSEPSLLSRSHRAAYLVVAPAAWRAAAEELAEVRRRQGLEAEVVDLDQIADEFNDGAPSPNSLRAFLSWVHTHWAVPPRYVALAGAGTVDYRDRLGFGEGFLPPLMVTTPEGLFPSDNRVGDVDGDGLPEVAIGRLPVASSTELAAYASKLAAYESAVAPAGAGRALFLADAADHGADFAAQSEGVAAQLPPQLQVDRAGLDTVPLADARAQTLAAFSQGTAWINYLGHGGLDRLSAAGLLTNADAAGLSNGDRLPVLTAMTCTVNRFAVPGIPALGELLVDRSGGGAAAVWGPTGLSSHGEARLLAERFYRTTGEPESARLGDRILKAMADYRALGGDPALLELYALLGDPALRLHAIPEPPPTGAGRSEE